MTDSNRYSAKISEPSDITSILSEARLEFAASVKSANAAAKYTLKADQGIAQKVKTAAPEDAAPAIAATAPAKPVDGVQDISEFPQFEFGEQPAPIKQNSVSVVPDKLFDLDPNLNKGVQPAIQSIKTDIEEEQIKISEPVSFNGACRSFPNENEIEPLPVFTVMTNHFGKDWVGWEPETIRQSIASLNLLPKDMPDLKRETLFDMIMALQLIFSHTGILDFWNMFEKTINALNFIKVNMRVIQPPSPANMVYGLRIIKLLRPDLKDDKPGEELAKYIAACCYQKGFLVVPSDLKDAQKWLNSMINTEEYNELAHAIWSAESRFYSMSDSEFDATLGKFGVSETPASIQTMKNISVIKYVRDKCSASDRQLGQTNLRNK